MNVSLPPTVPRSLSKDKYSRSRSVPFRRHSTHRQTCASVLNQLSCIIHTRQLENAAKCLWAERGVWDGRKEIYFELWFCISCTWSYSPVHGRCLKKGEGKPTADTPALPLHPHWSALFYFPMFTLCSLTGLNEVSRFTFKNKKPKSEGNFQNQVIFFLSAKHAAYFRRGVLHERFSPARICRNERRT